MKKITAIVLALAFSVIAYGQAQITTKKVKIEDFMEKTIKVVTSGNMFFDQALKDEVMNRWRISPFEFCTLEEFETLKTDDSYYFMLVTKDRFKREKEAGLSSSCRPFSTYCRSTLQGPWKRTWWHTEAWAITP